MSMPDHQLELLSPARDAAIGIEAVNHGADAVYIGGPSFGARSSADNNVPEIARLVRHAHRFNSRVFVTLNTILRDDELTPARQLAWQLYETGVDALIIQDMGLLALDLPPIQLHASTQTDIRTPEKARFLQDAGLSQLVLARELTLASTPSSVRTWVCWNLICRQSSCMPSRRPTFAHQRKRAFCRTPDCRNWYWRAS